MKNLKCIEIAVLLATYNGIRFIERQIQSLKDNSLSYTLHWLDDHSTDGTPDAVRVATRTAGIELREWHQLQHQGVPGAFFHLLECVDADVYLFCDQDDIWQAGKIDAAVKSLAFDLGRPVLCFSDPLVFKDDEPNIFHRLSAVMGATTKVALQESRLFMAGSAHGHTQAFTRPLRDIFLAHKDIARTYAVMHDVWMYDIAIASGGARILSDVPTTLYRWHSRNVTSAVCEWQGSRMGHIAISWEQHQKIRRGVSKHARGFVLASSTLPQSPKLDRLLSIARLMGNLDRRQSVVEIVRLLRRRVIWGSKRLAFGLAASCLCTDAADAPGSEAKGIF